MITLLKIAIKKKLIRIFDLQFGCLISQPTEYIIILVATCLSYANYIGHTCLPISVFEEKKFFPKKEKILIQKILNKIKNITNWEKTLLQYNIIGTGNTNTPLVIYHHQIYLNKNWNIEKKFFYFIKNSNIQSIQCIKYIKKIKKILLEITDKQQRIAIGLALIKKITFIIGGPGTGKTTIIKKIVNIMHIVSNNTINIKITASTGKAAYRITEMLQKNNNNKINDITATTLHHLLGIKQASHNTYFNKNNLLLIDVIIIDEASMIDLFTMNKLINALPKKTKIIFLGDVNQLPSIEMGSILKDICYYSNNTYSNKIKKLLQNITHCKIKHQNTDYNNITDCIYILKKNYRFHEKSNINLFSQSIFKNNIHIMYEVIKNKLKNIQYYHVNTNLQYHNMINKIIFEYSEYWNELLKCSEKNKIIQIFNKFQVICAIRNSAFGVIKLNEHIENILLQKNNVKTYWINYNLWYHGKPIIIRKNNKYLNLFNGDIGITMYNTNNQLEIFFLSLNNSIKKIPIHLLNNEEYEIAWCITIHKSQGSEFLHTAIILPNKFIHILNKELLYTAITRSIKKITIFSNNTTFIKTFKNYFIRYSGIKNMIKKNM